MNPRRVRLPDGRVWLRVAEPDWQAPLDPAYASEHGGRWNQPGSHPTLYLNADVATARARIARMLEGYAIDIEDLDDGAYVLVAATLPRRQACADAATAPGLRALVLPDTYPRHRNGREVAHRACQAVGRRVKSETDLRGVWCISASTRDRSGRELAWFPATRRSVAKPIWEAPLPLGAWRYATGWHHLGLEEQGEPEPL